MHAAFLRDFLVTTGVIGRKGRLSLRGSVIASLINQPNPDLCEPDGMVDMADLNPAAAGRPGSNPGARTNIDDLDVRLEACDYAARRLKRAGFMLVSVSRGSEACYYALPGRAGLLRVAAHSKEARDRAFGTAPVVSRLTFGANHGALSLDKLDTRIAHAAGRYILAAEPSI